MSIDKSYEEEPKKQDHKLNQDFKIKKGPISEVIVEEGC